MAQFHSPISVPFDLAKAGMMAPSVARFAGDRSVGGTIARALPWAMKGGCAILDQGLFAGTNFVANILLARWLAPDQYGSFAVAYSLLLFCSMFHTALVSEPMMVFGSGKYRPHFNRYLGRLLPAQIAIGAGLALLLACGAAAAFGLESPVLGSALGGAAVATPCILSLWVVRRAFYVRLQPAWAAAGGALYGLLLITCLIVLRQSGHISPASALAAMGGTALVVAGALILRLGPHWDTARECLKLRDISAAHWGYGQWAAATVPLAWGSDGMYGLLLPMFFGLAEAGALKALLNLVMPVFQSISAIGSVVLPLLVRDREQEQRGIEKVTARICSFNALCLLGGAMYASLLWAFRFQVLGLVYRGKYTGYASLPFFLASVLPFCFCCSEPIEAGLRALQKPNLIFRSYAIATVLSLTCIAPLVTVLGLTGALLGMLLSRSVVAISHFLSYRTYQMQRERMQLVSELKGEANSL